MMPFIEGPFVWTWQHEVYPRPTRSHREVSSLSSTDPTFSAQAGDTTHGRVIAEEESVNDALECQVLMRIPLCGGTSRHSGIQCANTLESIICLLNTGPRPREHVAPYVLFNRIAILACSINPINRPCHPPRPKLLQHHKVFS